MQKHVSEEESHVASGPFPRTPNQDPKPLQGLLRAQDASVPFRSTWSLVLDPEHLRQANPLRVPTCTLGVGWLPWQGMRVPPLGRASQCPLHLPVLCFPQGPPGPQGRLGQPGQQVRQAAAASPLPAPCLVPRAFNEPKCASRVQLVSEGTWAHEAFL